MRFSSPVLHVVQRPRNFDAARFLGYIPDVSFTRCCDYAINGGPAGRGPGPSGHREPVVKVEATGQCTRFFRAFSIAVLAHSRKIFVQRGPASHVRSFVSIEPFIVHFSCGWRFKICRHWDTAILHKKDSPRYQNDAIFDYWSPLCRVNALLERIINRLDNDYHKLQKAA